MEFLNASEAAQILKVSLRRVQQMCAKGEFKEAYKQGKSWFIPLNAVKSAVSAAKRAVLNADNNAMPVGVSSYKRAVSEYFYIDKTLFIKEIIDLKPQIILFTRPDGFGKTLNLDMLRTYFEKTDADTSIYFKNKRIWACGEKYRRYQGKYPVIYLSFKDVRFRTWADAAEKIRAVLREAFSAHRQVADSTDPTERESAYFKRVLDGTATQVELTDALAVLTKMLYAHYNVEPMIFIDEYDTPVRQGYAYGYYDEAVSFLRNLLSGGFKDNPYLSFGFVAGVLNLENEGVFGGMGNVISDSVLDGRFCGYFGFSKEEVWEMLAKFNKTDKFSEILEWYGGYNFGGRETVNPQSVVSYMDNSCRPKAFFRSVGKDFPIDFICAAQRETKDAFSALLQGQAVSTFVSAGVGLADFERNNLALYSYLVMFGYLKATINGSYDDMYRGITAIPNREIFTVFSKEINKLTENILPLNYAVAIRQAILSRDYEGLQTAFRDWLMRTVSTNEAAEESYYRDFIFCISASVGNRYRIKSEMEASEGRFGVCLYPRAKDFPAILIEVKEGAPNDNLSDLAKAAILKIDQKQYEIKLRNSGIEKIFKYGVAFSGKNVALVSVK